MIKLQEYFITGDYRNPVDTNTLIHCRVRYLAITPLHAMRRATRRGLIKPKLVEQIFKKRPKSKLLKDILGYANYIRHKHNTGFEIRFED